jgi:hypothetical protein
MPFVTFTVPRGLRATDKSRLSDAMLEAPAAADDYRADRFRQHPQHRERSTRR